MPDAPTEDDIGRTPRSGFSYLNTTSRSVYNALNIIRFEKKILLYLANVIILFMGIILLVFGVLGCRLPGPQLNSSQPAFAMGGMTCFATILWFSAYIFKQNLMHIGYLILLMCLIGSQMVFAFRALMCGDEKVVRAYLRNVYSLRKEADEVGKEVKEFQARFKCCGFDGPNGSEVVFTQNVYLSIGNDTQKVRNVTSLIPECCMNLSILCTILEAYDEGCAEKIIQEHNDWERALGLIFLITALILIMFAFVDISQFGPAS